MKTNIQKLRERIKEIHRQGGSVGFTLGPESKAFTSEEIAGGLLKMLSSIEATKRGCPHGHEFGKDFEKYNNCETPLKCPTDFYSVCKGTYSMMKANW